MRASLRLLYTVHIMSISICSSFSLFRFSKSQSLLPRSFSKLRASATKKQSETKTNVATVENPITPRDVDYSAWYTEYIFSECLVSVNLLTSDHLSILIRYNDVIYSSDMVDQSPVRGCMVLKPWGMGVWDILKNDLDNRIRETGMYVCYLFISM